MLHQISARNEILFNINKYSKFRYGETTKCCLGYVWNEALGECLGTNKLSVYF